MFHDLTERPQEPARLNTNFRAPSARGLSNFARDFMIHTPREQGFLYYPVEFKSNWIAISQIQNSEETPINLFFSQFFFFDCESSLYHWTCIRN